MARYHDVRWTYVGAERFIDAATRADGFILTPGRAIWSLQLLDEFDRRKIQQPDLRSDANFEDKLGPRTIHAGQPDSASLIPRPRSECPP